MVYKISLNGLCLMLIMSMGSLSAQVDTTQPATSGWDAKVLCALYLWAKHHKIEALVTCVGLVGLGSCAFEWYSRALRPATKFFDGQQASSLSQTWHEQLTMALRVIVERDKKLSPRAKELLVQVYLVQYGSQPFRILQNDQGIATRLTEADKTSLRLIVKQWAIASYAVKAGTYLEDACETESFDCLTFQTICSMLKCLFGAKSFLDYCLRAQ